MRIALMSVDGIIGIDTFRHIAANTHHRGLRKALKKHYRDIGHHPESDYQGLMTLMSAQDLQNKWNSGNGNDLFADNYIQLYDSNGSPLVNNSLPKLHA